MSILIDTKQSFVAICPLMDIAHFGEIEDGETCQTGLPFFIVCSSESSVLGLVYSEYVLDDGIVTSGTLRPHDWYVNLTASENQDVIDGLNLNSNFNYSSFKHKDREEYAFPMNDTMLGMVTEGAFKTSLEATMAAKLAAGDKKTKAQMLSDNWI